ncbi:hypothetical protein CLOM_g23903 [Closterium sp. NIES-68]|nr:hypothetical protein CLOM_g23903 [Closterium sp. NIES-68]GJP58718.1 hypothetical protein CLOP_g3309 [Closterium sp. NIES-67]
MRRAISDGQQHAVQKAALAAVDDAPLCDQGFALVRGEKGERGPREPVPDANGAKPSPPPADSSQETSEKGATADTTSIAALDASTDRELTGAGDAACETETCGPVQGGGTLEEKAESGEAGSANESSRIALEKPGEGTAEGQQAAGRGRLRELVRRAEVQRRVMGYLDVGKEVARSVERQQLLHRLQHVVLAPGGAGQGAAKQGGVGQGGAGLGFKEHAGHGDREHGGAAGNSQPHHGPAAPHGPSVALHGAHVAHHAEQHALTERVPLHDAPRHHVLGAVALGGGRVQQLQAEGGGGEGMGRDESTNSNMGAAEWLEGCLEDEEEWQRWRIDPQQLVIKEFIARGTYGSVHRGEYKGKQVAVKLMDWGEVDKASRAKLTFLRDVFAQEVLVWSTLQHKNICQFVGALLGGPDSYCLPSTVEDHRGVLRVGSHVCCVVLEYLAGGTLKHVLIKHYHRKLSVQRVVHIALDIAEGLEYLHSRGIVHRDVKSDNMLLDKHHRVVKIADFGVSRVQSEDSTMHHKTGTYGYMAPEVLKERPYDHKADVYSFGILLWEVYCCDNPFPYTDLDPDEIASTVNQGLRPDIPSCCPPQLADLMRRCWHREPGRRPDMSEVVRKLKAFDCRHATPMRPVEDESSCAVM